MRSNNSSDKKKQYKHSRDIVVNLGIDQSFSSTGFTWFENHELVLAGLIYEHKRKGLVSVKGKVDYSATGVSHFISDIQYQLPKDDIGDLERMDKLYSTYHKLFTRIRLHYAGNEYVIKIVLGIEIPMGRHQGAGAKADRVYAIASLAFSHAFFGNRNQIRYAWTPSQIKKFVTGKGNASKEMVAVGVYKKWKFEGSSNDVTDAYGIGKLTEKESANKEEDNNG